MPAETLNCPMCGAPASHGSHAVRPLRRTPGDGDLPVVLWDDVRRGEVLFALRREGGSGRDRGRGQAGIVPALPRGDERGGHRRHQLARVPALRGDLGGHGFAAKNLRGPGEANGGAGKGRAADDDGRSGVGDEYPLHPLPGVREADEPGEFRALLACRGERMQPARDLVRP